jgi:hypothetical protein
MNLAFVATDFDGNQGRLLLDIVKKSNKKIRLPFIAQRNRAGGAVSKTGNRHGAIGYRR